MEVKQALAELRKDKERKFDQSVDLVINLKGVDIKRDNISLVVDVPNKIKEKKVCGFFSERSSDAGIEVITEVEFAKYKDKDKLKKLVDGYGFFIAEAKLMPKVATTFGKVLGPAGKMPSPQLGILPVVNKNSIDAVLEKISKSIKIRAKEASIKLGVGKVSMDDDKLIANINAIYKAIEEALPGKRENVKNVSLKFTMSKPLRVEIK